MRQTAANRHFAVLGGKRILWDIFGRDRYMPLWLIKPSTLVAANLTTGHMPTRDAIAVEQPAPVKPEGQFDGAAEVVPLSASVIL